ncbi:class I SAM-dependent methyltransferase [Streptomyces inhibens]|uniref:class I SAM-dependent methyltransferase n=1 Tax=Streptomyces inhibens TaxID=2293571 RepID=UPI001EE6F1CB|nr:class I SAM-dependent methyltransferase [Streptomyces inhibens]UKY53396.1 methyltransferase domain-containing protein [Streptomyces inhibens]
MSKTVTTIAEVYNHALAASAISAAWEVGIFDALREAGPLDAEAFAAEQGLDAGSVQELFRALAAADVVSREGVKVRPGPNFEEADRSKSLFHWMTKGCGELFSTLPDLIREENRVGSFYRRDAAAISVACREINAEWWDPVFRPVVSGLDFSYVADLGCGSGERLIRLAQSRPGVRGLGIDAADGAIEVSTKAVADAGLSDRISITQGDATQLEPRAEYAGVDLLTSFMMGHDFWPRAEAVASLRRIREVFPDLKHFLLADATRTTTYSDTEMPVFSMAFEFAHAVMGDYLPTLEEWGPVFEEAGWRLVEAHPISVPADSVMFHLVPAN